MADANIMAAVTRLGCKVALIRIKMYVNSSNFACNITNCNSNSSKI